MKRLVAAGDDVIVLDKMTYAGNPRNLEGVDVDVIRGDIADAAAVERAGEGCQAAVNFAAETHVDRSILSAADFIQTDVYGTYILLEWAKATGPGSFTSRPTRSTVTCRKAFRQERATASARRARTLRPRPAGISRCSRMCARSGSTP